MQDVRVGLRVRAGGREKNLKGFFEFLMRSGWVVSGLGGEGL